MKAQYLDKNLIDVKGGLQHIFVCFNNFIEMLKKIHEFIHKIVVCDEMKNVVGKYYKFTDVVNIIDMK